MSSNTLLKLEGEEGVKNSPYYWVQTPEGIEFPNAKIDTKTETGTDRKKMPVYTGVMKYFPNALKYVSRVSQAGNDQHHPEKTLHWDKSKSFDHTDALARHLIDHSQEPIDDDGMLHLGKVAWRALAALEIYLDEDNS